MLGVPAQTAPVWNDRDAAFYAEHLAASDYLTTVGETLRRLVGATDHLIDVGAGSGLLGRSLLNDGGHWRAFEPNAYMRGCIQTLAAQSPSVRLNLHADLWQDIPTLMLPPADVVLCANIPVDSGQAVAFVEATRPLAKRALVWNLPAQQGPRTYCLSGFLPPSLHGSDCTPGYLLALEELGERLRPDSVHFTRWHFSTVFPTYANALAHFLEKLPPLGVERREELEAYLEVNLEKVNNGLVARAPKVAASLVWQN